MKANYNRLRQAQPDNRAVFGYVKDQGLPGWNSSGASANGYTDYTHMPAATLTKGDNFTLTYSGASQGLVSPSRHWYAWIDYNRDGVFEASEQIPGSASSSNASLSVNFTVPASAAGGTTHLRIITSVSQLASACGTIAEGEVEDYPVTIEGLKSLALVGDDEGAADCLAKATADALVVYPNPGTGAIRVKGDFPARRLLFSTTRQYQSAQLYCAEKIRLSMFRG